MDRNQQKVREIHKWLQSNQGPGIKNINEITTNIYCSDFASACNVDLVHDYRIQTIISLGDTKPNDVIEAYKKRKINHIQISIKDSPMQQLEEALMRSYDIIRDHVIGGHKILIHCNAGVSRAPSIIIGYFLRRQYLISYNKYVADAKNMKNDKFKYLEELANPEFSKILDFIKFVKQYRPCIEPNPGFIFQLLMFEQYLKKHIKISLDKLIAEDQEEIKHKKQAKVDNDESSDEEPAAVVVEELIVDTLEDIDNLNISDDETEPLEIVPKRNIVIATGDNVNEEHDLSADEKNNEPIPEELPDEDFDLDF